MPRRRLSVLLLAAALLAGCGRPSEPGAAPSGGQSALRHGAKGERPRPGAKFVVLKTSKGSIKAMLYAKEVPATIAVFQGLADKRFYDGLTFHRVIPGFMIQTGDPTAKGDGGAGFTFKDEFRKDLKFDRSGMLGMANFGPDTNNGQFFITLAPRPDLDGMHTVFGEVTEGMEVAKAISMVPRDEFDSADKPLKPVYLESVRVKDKPASP